MIAKADCTQGLSSHAAQNDRLLRIALSHESAARNQAAAALQPALRAIAFAVARQFKRIDAYDCATESIQDWWCHGPHFAEVAERNPTRPLWPYARQSLRFITISAGLKRQRRAHQDVDALDIAETESTSQSPVERAERLAALERGLGLIAEPARVALALRYEERMTFSQIADRFSVSPATAYRRIQCAVNSLRAELSALA